MGAVNDLITEIGLRMGNRSDVSNRLLTWLNYAYLELIQTPKFEFYEFDLSLTIPTVANQAGYDILSLAAFNLWYVLDLTDTTNNRKLKMSHWFELDRVVPTTGQPTRYYRFGSSIYLDPVPDGVYNLVLRYKKKPAVVQPGTATEIGNEWDEPLVVLASIKGWEALDQRDKAMASRQLYGALMSQRLDALQLDKIDTDFNVQVKINEVWNG